MNEIPLETVVIVLDREHPQFGELGHVRNDWLATFVPSKVVYSVEINGSYHEFDRDQIETCACPDCGLECETFRPCPGCGLTIEKIVERTLAR